MGRPLRSGIPDAFETLCKGSLGLILGLFLAGCDSQPTTGEYADIIIQNGVIFTADSSQPFAEAVAIKDGRFVFVGSGAGVAAFVGADTEVVELDGRMAMPGINDAHIHPFTGTVKELYECVFAFLATPDEVAAALAKCVAEAPEDGSGWITGGQWDSDFFKNYPLASPKALLDSVSGDLAVAFADDSGHNLWVNSKALELAGITKDTPDPVNGIIVRDAETGEPNGVLLENAVTILESVVPERSAAELLVAARRFVEIANRLGITGLKDANSRPAYMAAFKSLDEQGGLTLHAAVAISTPYGYRAQVLDYEAIEKAREQYASEHVHTDFVKIFMDGVPTASRTAAMLAPYVPDEAGKVTRGFVHVAEEILSQDLIELDKRGFTVKIHTAGDWSVQIALNAIAAARAANGRSGLRHELAHAGYIDPADMDRFAALNVVADVSPILWYPSPIIGSVLAAVGERGKEYWPIRSFLDDGSHVAAGSDWPSVSPTPSPWPGIEAFVTRADPYGVTPGTLWKEQAIKLEEAMEIYTMGGARALRLQDDTGSITPGKSADIIVLDRNLFEIPISDVGETEIVKTFFEGRLVYQQPE